MTRRLRSIAVACSVATVAGLHAQPAPATIRGQLVHSDGATAAASVLIEASERPAGPAAARGVTTVDGRFRLQLPRGGTFFLRALRVGYRPTEFGAISVTADVVLDRPLVLRGAPLVLSSVRIEDRAVCGGDAADEATADLLAAARTGLAGTLMAVDGPGAAAEWTEFSVITDHLGTPLSGIEVRRRHGASVRPFRSVPGDAILRQGFLVRDSLALVYRAPDAEFLLSDEFIGRHCFRRTAETADGEELVGLAFEPATNWETGLVGVRGTLWLAVADGALRRLGFSYTGVDAAVADAGAGGEVWFEPLADGTWVASRWRLRMPRPTTMLRDGRHEPAVVVDAIDVVGGQVDRVAVGERSLYESASSYAGLLQEVHERSDQPPVCRSARDLGRNYAGLLYGSVRDSTGQIVPGARVRIEWPHPGGVPSARDAAPASRELIAQDGFFLLCGLPVEWRLRIWASSASATGTPAPLRIPRVRPAIAMDLVVPVPVLPTP